MFDDVDHLHDLFESTWRCCAVLRGWIGSLIPEHCTDVTGLQSVNHLSKLIKEREHQLSTSMYQEGLIEIISSDSDLEEIEPVGRRANPAWLSAPASGSNSRSKDYANTSRKVPSPRRAHVYNGISPNYNHHRQVLEKFHPSSSADIRASNQQFSQADSSAYFSQNGNALKRTLPLSMQGLNPAVDKRAHNQFRDTTNKGFMRNHSIRGNDDYMYDRRPPFVKSPATSQIPSSSEPQYPQGRGEERVAESDERLIYQAALQDLNQPKVEAALPDGLLSVSLLRHQKIALAWMLQKETRSLHCLGGILADDQGLGKTISMIALIQMQRSLQSKSKPEHLDNNKTEALNLDDDDEDHVSCGSDKVNNTEESDLKSTREASTSAQPFNKKRPAAGTLVVCPASVLRQWARELDEKVAEEAKLSVLVYHGGCRTRNPEELAGYDVVMTTYAIVTNEVPKQPLVDEDEADERNEGKYGLSCDFSINKKRKKASSVSKKGKKGRKGFDSSSFECGSGPLARVGWSRVILDEAQTIKNHRTQVARACCSLRAKTRWCLSGTPIQNTIDDLYSYFRFLKYDPYAVYKSFYSTIKVPISRNSLQGYKKLQAVLRAIMLRRTKGTMIDGQPIINLPPKTINLSKVEFSSEERAFYTKLEADSRSQFKAPFPKQPQLYLTDSRSQFKAYAAAGTVNQNYANILLMLLRLRQACDHPLLVKGYDTDCVGKDSVAMASTLSREMLIDLLNALESETICRVCNDVLENPVVTMCRHVFCYQCVSESMTSDDSMCPAIECKKQVGPDVVFSESTLISCLSKDLDGGATNFQLIEKPVVVQNEYTSSKVRAVIEIIQSHCKSNIPNLKQYNAAECSRDSLKNENPDSGINVVKRTTVFSNSPNDGPMKAIIFSQWTKMLDLVENAMNEYCIQYKRLDGTMTLTSRDRAVKEFNTDPEVTVMLMSLKAGNLGLNMVSACHVILLDLWWNPTTEDQAVDRAHRIGQTRPVTVTRLTIKDTVEDRILALQDEKRKMVASAFGEDNGGGSGTRLTVEDLRYLFMV